MSTVANNPLEAFQWQRQPRAEQFVLAKVHEFLNRLPAARILSDRMERETGTRFFDWVDHLRLMDTTDHRRQLDDAGYTEVRLDLARSADTFIQSRGLFPPIVLDRQGRQCLAIKVESIADFAAVHQLQLTEGEALTPYREQVIEIDRDLCFLAVERHGDRGFQTTTHPPRRRLAMLRHLEQFRTRAREFESDELGFTATESLINNAIAELGVDPACDLFFKAEREFWQARNRAAQFQKSRQDRLGLGWANHDHHTYRSSRLSFARMIVLFEKLGLVCRERFYAGREAGWGAQVMEQQRSGIVVFADVDLSPDELLNDFAHVPLPARDRLGTVGLWCGLHGESFLQAGMHHLECQFDFDSLKTQLETAGLKVMKPFTDFPYLRQAFTEGERWPVAGARIQKLLDETLITPEQAEQFRRHGAIGSHLENLERNEGFKGFNQKGVSEIIAATDPRKH